jgi:hypothetical protein
VPEYGVKPVDKPITMRHKIWFLRNQKGWTVEDGGVG